MKKNLLRNKWLLFGGLGLLGLLLIGTRFLNKESRISILPKPTPTPLVRPTMIPLPEKVLDWQVYTQRQYGFSIYYPDEWDVVEKKQNPPDLAIKVYPKRWAGQQLPWATSANVTVDSSKLAKDEFEKFQKREKQAILDNKVENKNFAGENCFEVTSELPNTGGFGSEILCLKNNLVFRFQIFSYYPPKTEKELAEEILLTFRFLN